MTQEQEKEQRTANKKQMGLLAHRAKQAGVEWKYTDGKGLTDEQIDAKLEEFDRIKAQKGVLVEQVEQPQQTVVEEVQSVNKYRLGMAQKIVAAALIDKSEVGTAFPFHSEQDRKFYVDQVRALYRCMTEAETTLGGGF